MYPETLLLPRKDRKNVTTEEDKEGTLKKVTIYAISVGEYVPVQKFMKLFVSKF